MEDAALTAAQSALQYAERGWKIFPLHTPRGEACSCGLTGCKIGKHPRIGDWQNSGATSDPQIVANWWTQWPDANIGMRLDDLAVLDVDPKNGGFESLAVLEEEYGALQAFARQRSGSGGWHYLFKAIAGMNTAKGFRPGLDLLTGPGCYIVAAPSLHVSQGRYEWTDHPKPLDWPRNQIVLQDPPEWLRAVATRKPGPGKKAPERVPTEQILSAAVRRISDGEGRNDSGLWLFTQLRDNKYDRDEASLILRDWVNKANAATPGQDRYSMREAEATLRSAYKREAREPWENADKDSQADVLLGLIGDFEYFKSGPSNDAYVRFAVGDHKEVWRVDPKAPKVREVLTHRYLEHKDRAPGREALNTVIDTILAKCGAGPKVDVYVRFARRPDVIYLDLCNDRWQAVEIDRDGWRIVDSPPVFFRRAAGAQALPIPEAGGTLDLLRPLLNASNNEQWLLMIAWLVGTFQPVGAFVHLVLEGEQGSAKSTSARVLQSALDPNDAGLSAPPKDETDATVSALNAGILAYDNLSGCRAELSDVFCRFSTGQGYKTRTLYENLGLTIASVKLPIMLNGIDATIMRGDLLERSITLRLPRITAAARLTEQGIWNEFESVLPKFIGALLDVVSVGLRNFAGTKLEEAPRMSDFCTWLVACEPALPWKSGAFLDTYRRKMVAANADLAESDPVTAAILDWAERRLKSDKAIVLTAKEWLIQLNGMMADSPKDLRYWPSNPESLAHKLARIAPVLRSQGVEVRKLPRNRVARSRWEITMSDRQQRLPSQT